MSDVDQYLTRIKDSKPAPGFEEVLYAGLPENNEEKERSEKGIPYHSIISRPENCSTPDAEFKYNQMKKFLNLKWTKRKKKFLYDDKWDNLIAGIRLGITPRYAHDWI